MSDIENKILSFLELGYKVDEILKELNMNKENLADIIIELDSKGLIDLKDKNWILTQKGKDILKEMKELLQCLKLEYVYGNISRDQFLEKRKELEDMIMIEKPKQDNIKKENITCPQCGKDNKSGSKYCYKCGTSLYN